MMGGVSSAVDGNAKYDEYLLGVTRISDLNQQTS